MRTPGVILRDPELIRQITIKDFDSFVNHRNVINSDVEPLLGNSLISLQGNYFKNIFLA